MPWTLDEIEREWLGGQRLQLPPEDVERAFATAERVRGREWVLSTTSVAGGGRQWGLDPFFRVYAFGKHLQGLDGVLGASELLARLLDYDGAAESELAAVSLLRAQRLGTEVEIGPEVVVGDRNRRPDFRIRVPMAPWTYVEVTQLGRSGASTRTQELLRRVGIHLISILQPFLLEIVFWRDPVEEGEEGELVRQASEACRAADGQKRTIGDLACLLVKSGDPRLVIPSILPEDNKTHMGFAMSVAGLGEPNRQILVRVPFADQRAETVLTKEAKQLPKDESGLIMVDVGRQVTAFASWAELVPLRFTPTQHTRVGGVLLFMTATTMTTRGIVWAPYLKLIPNPHARIPLPGWISEVVEVTRTETRRLVG